MIVLAGTAILSLVAIYTAERGPIFDFGAAKRRLRFDVARISEPRGGDFDLVGAAKRRLRFGVARLNTRVGVSPPGNHVKENFIFFENRRFFNFFKFCATSTAKSIQGNSFKFVPEIAPVMVYGRKQPVCELLA